MMMHRCADEPGEQKRGEEMLGKTRRENRETQGIPGYTAGAMTEPPQMPLDILPG